MKKAELKQNREFNIDFLRVLAILLIVLFHLLYEIYLNNSLRPLGFIGVSLFFIISGYLLAKKYQKLEKFSLKWFIKRYLKVAIVYYFALIVIVLLFGRQTYSGKFLDLFLHFLFLDPLFKSSAYSIISPAWFFTPLIFLYLFFPYINKYVRKSIFFLIAGFLIMFFARELSGTWTSWSPLFFLGEFCFGIAFANGKKYSAILVSLLAALISPFMFLPFLIFFIFSYFDVGDFSSKLLGLIGTNTFVLFLYHEAVIKVLFGKWHVYGISIEVSFTLLTLVILVASYLSLKIQNYLLNKLESMR